AAGDELDVEALLLVVAVDEGGEVAAVLDLGEPVEGDPDALGVLPAAAGDEQERETGEGREPDEGARACMRPARARGGSSRGGHAREGTTEAVARTSAPGALRPRERL